MNKLTDELLKSLNNMGIQHVREIPNQGICGLEGYGYLVSVNCDMDYFGNGYRYCYESFEDAFNAVNNWDGNGHPPGPWIKRKNNGDT